MIRGVHRITIQSPRPSRLLEFYRDILGFKELDLRANNNAENIRGDTTEYYLLKAQNICIEIRAASESSSDKNVAGNRSSHSGFSSLGLDVVDLHEVLRRFVSAGLNISSERRDFGSFCSASVQDPDGNQIDILQLKSPFDEAQVFWSDPPLYV